MSSTKPIKALNCPDTNAFFSSGGHGVPLVFPPVFAIEPYLSPAIHGHKDLNVP
jgi:hypothetical protein